METANLLILVLLMGVIAYFLGRSRAYAVAKPLGGIRHLHSLPYYYGMRAALWCFIPSFVLFLFWMALDEKIITSVLVSELPRDLQPATEADRNLLLNQIADDEERARVYEEPCPPRPSF